MSQIRSLKLAIFDAESRNDALPYLIQLSSGLTKSCALSQFAGVSKFSKNNKFRLFYVGTCSMCDLSGFEDDCTAMEVNNGQMFAGAGGGGRFLLSDWCGLVCNHTAMRQCLVQFRWMTNNGTQ